MKGNYAPSTNIVRDSKNDLIYLVTPNAEKTATKILNDFRKGYHAYTIIGSYGTGKSSFLWAFQQSLLKKKKLFELSLPKGITNVDIINFNGSYSSIIEAFNEYFSIKKDYSSHQKLFDSIFSEYVSIGNNGLLIITIDEFGKFLEFAANSNPEKEMYFIQQLAEFVNDPDRNILLLTTLHQGVDAYSTKLNDGQRNEWRKVKGRFQEITFNEPIEQLLSLASSHFVEEFGETKETAYSKQLVKLQKSKHIFSAKQNYFQELGNTLYPLDLFSAYSLTLALQKYGQNERSLFTFLQASDDLNLSEYKSDHYFSLGEVFDYLWNNYYHYLSSKSNPDYSNWSAIRDAIQRAEIIDQGNIELMASIVKTVGLLQIFSSKGASIDDEFIIGYYSNQFDQKDVQNALKLLQEKRYQIIKFSRFNSSYKLFQGTDLDIDGALSIAENQISEDIDLVAKLNTHFEFPVLMAKSHSYQTGAPRLFEFVVSESPIYRSAEGEIDGYINLVFESAGAKRKVLSPPEERQAIMYCYFNNTEKIVGVLRDIEKTEQVLKAIESDGDRVALRELQSIQRSNKVLLNHYVLDSLFDTNIVKWVCTDESTPIIRNKRELNSWLSTICGQVYREAPVLRNELFNKHKISPAIATARKNYFEALVNNFDKEDLGFEDSKFPPEKTIYYSLLVETGIHTDNKGTYSLSKPPKNSSLYSIWQVCEDFLSDAKTERKSISELIDKLSQAPYKLKQGVIDFWVPTFLFIRRGDYALYADGAFKPYINDQELYLITRVPKEYTLKSFELNDLRLTFFNKYRDFLKQDTSNELTVNSFIESIRPILLMYKGLTGYAQNTKSISKEARDLRDAIKSAQDPEKVFFDEFPKAIGYDAQELLKSNESFDGYIYKFQETLDEIRNAYFELLNRIEGFIKSEIIGRNCDFATYKSELSKRYKTLKDHQLNGRQKTFLQRINSPLNDRDSWLASIGQTILGKVLTEIEDKDEFLLKEKLQFILQELDNLVDIAKVKFDSEKEDVYKIDFTSQKGGLIPYIVRLPKDKLKKEQKSIDSIKKELSSDKQTRIAILAKLLREELSDE